MKILILIGTIITLCGIILIYDARPITKKNFGFGDQNDATLGLKITGFLFSIIGGLIMFFNF